MYGLCPQAEKAALGTAARADLRLRNEEPGPGKGNGKGALGFCSPRFGIPCKALGVEALANFGSICEGRLRLTWELSTYDVQGQLKSAQQRSISLGPEQKAGGGGGGRGVGEIQGRADAPRRSCRPGPGSHGGSN